MKGQLVIREDDLQSALTAIRQIKDAFENDSNSSDSLVSAVGHRRLGDEVSKFSSSWRINRQRIVDSLNTLYQGLQTIDSTFDEVDSASGKGIAQGGIGDSVIGISTAVTKATHAIAAVSGDTSGVSVVDQATRAATAAVLGGNGSPVGLQRVQEAVAHTASSVGHVAWVGDPLDLGPEPSTTPPSAITLQKIEQVLERVEGLMLDRDAASRAVFSAAVAAMVSGLFAALNSDRPLSPDRSGVAGSREEAPFKRSAALLQGMQIHGGMQIPGAGRVAEGSDSHQDISASDHPSSSGGQAYPVAAKEAVAAGGLAMVGPSGSDGLLTTTLQGPNAMNSTQSATPGGADQQIPVSQTHAGIGGPQGATYASGSHAVGSRGMLAPMAAMGGSDGGRDRSDGERAEAARRALASWRGARDTQGADGGVA